MKILFLDDNKNRGELFRALNPGTTWVQTAGECIALLDQDWDVISLDHDLGGEYFVDSERDDCGMAVVRYLESNQPEHLRHTEFIVHSHNADAAKEMVEALRSAGFTCRYDPFAFFSKL